MTISSSRRNHFGFTLVELLVVIGIIAVMISILLPALTKARESANRTACLANLKQFGVLMCIYANENRGYLPGPNNMAPSGWYYLAQPFADRYVRTRPTASNRTIYRCPSDELYDRLADYWTSYGVNLKYTEVYNNLFGVIYPARRISACRNPTRLALMVETYGHSQWDGQYLPPTNPYTHWPATAFRHMRGVNALFLDGHADWKTAKEVPAIQSYPGFPVGKIYNTYFHNGQIDARFSTFTIPGL